MHKEFSPEKKQQLIEFQAWVRSLVPQLPKNATTREIWDEMTLRQQRRVLKRLDKIMDMK